MRNNTNFLQHQFCRRPNIFVSTFPDLPTQNLNTLKWIPTLSSGGLNIALLPHSYSLYCITDVNSNCVRNCATVSISDNAAACTELSVFVTIQLPVPNWSLFQTIQYPVPNSPLVSNTIQQCISKCLYFR